MLSVVITIEGDPASLDKTAVLRAVTKSLAALVGAVVEDVVADAFVIARPGFDFRAVEDGTGCGAVLDADPGAALRAALARARRPYILLLRAGYAPGPGFAEEVGSLLVAGSLASALALRGPPMCVLDRLAPGRRTAGLVASRRSLEALPARSLQTLQATAQVLSARPLRAGAVRL